MSNLYEEHKKLKNRVQELEDQLYKMKKYYEDALQNLSDDNFSASFVSEKRGMKSQITMTAEAIKTMVTDSDFTSRLEQTAGEIKAEVESADGELETKITTTAAGINAQFKDYQTKADADSQKVYLEGQIDASASGIKEEFAEIAEGLSTKITTVETTAEGIKTTISALENTVAGKVGTSELEDSAEELRTEIEATSKEIKTTVRKSFIAYQIVDSFNEKDSENDKNIIYKDDAGFHYYDDVDDSWKTSTSNTFFSQFRQTAEGFEMIGNLSTTTQDDMKVNISGTRLDVYGNLGTNSKKMSMGIAGTELETQYPVIVMGGGDVNESDAKSNQKMQLYDFNILQGQGVIAKDEDQFRFVYFLGDKEYAGMWITKPTESNGWKSQILLNADEFLLNGSQLSSTAVFG